MKIKSISLEYPNCNDGTAIYYEVGKQNLMLGGKVITSIQRMLKNGEMALVPYYEILTEDGLAAELHHYSHIVYEAVK